jgi:hypothetical protein
MQSWAVFNHQQPNNQLNNHLHHPAVISNAIDRLQRSSRTLTGVDLFAAADPLYDHSNEDRPNRAARRRRKNTKITGDLGEAAFLYYAVAHGLWVARPWGDNRRYDVLVQARPDSNRFHRVQVKCTESLSVNGYQVRATYCDRKRKGKYTAADIDFLVAYVVPHNIFYIVPIHAIPPSANLRFYPTGSPRHRARFERYREAWHLLDQRPRRRD